MAMAARMVGNGSQSIKARVDTHVFVLAAIRRSLDFAA
jgi:hypothetical protein